MAYTTINKSTDYFNTKLYTGNGSTNAITGVGHNSDFVWIKSRADSYSHFLFDAVRGVYKRIKTNSTDAETESNESLKSFDSDGFTLGTQANINNSGSTYASWNWKANGAGSANTDGATNSTVSVNTAAGFSIVSWTGTGSATTVGHGLGAAPELIILKNRTGVYGWQTYWKVLGSNKYLSLSSTDAAVTSTQSWNNTAPTSTVFSVDGDSNNKSGQNIVAYCFKEKTGYSKFGSYTGNGNADGTFVYTGFKPAWIMIKDTAARSWIILDNKRNTFNVVNNRLFPDASDAQNTGVNALDFLSNGIKIRSDNSSLNVSGNTYIYMAFGQSIVGSNNVPAVAR